MTELVQSKSVNALETNKISNLGIWLVRPESKAIGELLRDKLGGEVFFPWQNSKEGQKEQFQNIYTTKTAWILVMTTGIAVRFIEGIIQNKLIDPAVVVIDEGCHHAISLLGGHEAGANKLAYAVANVTGATPVITTATEATKSLVVGIGCRKNVSCDQIDSAIRYALGSRELNEIREVVTIDLKAEEPGLLEFCNRYGLPLRIFSKKQIADRAWVSNPSEWVRENIGVDGVCEPCALLANPQGQLIVPKVAQNGVAVAIVADNALSPNEVI
jgi:cobalt-precorrin 5A hydrolase